MYQNVLSLFCLLMISMGGFVQAADRPNILFIFTDDHAPHAIGAYQGWLKDVNPTPNIDKLANEGMLFRNSFCTNSICGPSRAVILTGKHSHLNGFRKNGDRFNGDQQTFPKLLQKTGYQTAIIGKWHLSSDPQGFDHWEILPGQGDYYNPMFKTAKGRVKSEGYCTDIVTTKAVRWLKNQRDSEKPFMLMCQHKAPHRTWMPALRHINLYDNIEIPEPETLFDDYQDNASPARHQEMEIDRHMNLVYDLHLQPFDGWDPDAGVSVDKSGFRNLQRMTPDQLATWNRKYSKGNQAFLDKMPTGKDLVKWKFQRYAKNYLRCIKGVDESVGRLRNTLDELGLSDNTIVIYSSDQGFYIGDHGWYDKRWMYDESLKMPFICKWPGVTNPGTINDELIQNLDYAETFLEIAGADIPEDMQGASLVSLLKGERSQDWREAIYYHYHEYPSYHMVAKHYGIRTHDYKLIHFYQFGEWEFYDLKNDPDESTNLYQNPDYASLIKEYQAKLEEYRLKYQDDSDISEMSDDWKAQYRP